MNENKKPKKPLFITNLLIGGISGVVSRTFTAPLELKKIQLQNKYMPNTTFREVIKKEGLKGLWKGNYINCIRIFPQTAINYAFFQLSKNNIFSKTLIIKNNTNLTNFLSGTVGGIVSMTAVYPLENIRSRFALQTNKNHYTSIIDVFRKTPLPQLYNGLRMSLLGFAPYNSLNFMFYNYFRKKYWKENEIYAVAYQLFYGGLAGCLSVSFTYPTDLIRRRLQLQGFDTNVPKYDGIKDCIRKIYKSEGIIGFYRGLGACYIKIIPAVGIQFYVIEQLKYFNYKFI